MRSRIARNTGSMVFAFEGNSRSLASSITPGGILFQTSHDSLVLFAADPIVALSRGRVAPHRVSRNRDALPGTCVTRANQVQPEFTKGLRPIFFCSRLLFLASALLFHRNIVPCFHWKTIFQRLYPVSRFHPALYIFFVLLRGWH